MLELVIGQFAGFGGGLRTFLNRIEAVFGLLGVLLKAGDSGVEISNLLIERLLRLEVDESGLLRFERFGSTLDDRGSNPLRLVKIEQVGRLDIAFD